MPMCVFGCSSWHSGFIFTTFSEIPVFPFKDCFSPDFCSLIYFWPGLGFFFSKLTCLQDLIFNFHYCFVIRRVLSCIFMFSKFFFFFKLCILSPTWLVFIILQNIFNKSTIFYFYLLIAGSPGHFLAIRNQFLHGWKAKWNYRLVFLQTRFDLYVPVSNK